VKPALPLPFAARVLENQHPAGGTSMREDDIRNELLEAGVVLHFAARTVARIRWAEQIGQIAVNFSRKAIEVPQAMK
jgi:hypothetical protein